MLPSSIEINPMGKLRTEFTSEPDCKMLWAIGHDFFHTL